jgi:hypothetical protein
VALLGSKFGSENKPFLGSMAAPEWSPNLLTLGQLYSFSPNTRYKLMLRVAAAEALGKMWNVLDPEPTSFQVLGIMPWKTGRGVGFYVYGAYDAVLETMIVTVP